MYGIHTTHLLYIRDNYSQYFDCVQSKFRASAVCRGWWYSSKPEGRADDFAEFDPAGESDRRLPDCIYRQYSHHT